MPRFSWKDSSVLITLAFITGTSARPSPFFETGPMVATPEGKVCKDGEIGIGTQTTDEGTKGVIVANNCNLICSNGPVLSAANTYCTGGFDDESCSVTCSSAFGSLGQPSEAVTTDKRHWNQCYRPNIAQTCMISTGATIIDWCCIGSDSNSDSSADAPSSTSEASPPASTAGSDSPSGSGSNPPSDDGTSKPSNADSNSPPDASSPNDNTPTSSDSTSGTPVDPSANAAGDAGSDSTSAIGDDSDNSDGDASSVVRKRRVRL